MHCVCRCKSSPYKVGDCVDLEIEKEIADQSQLAGVDGEEIWPEGNS